jgi:hypothetical protein
VCCISNYMNLNVNKTRVISFRRKTNCRGFWSQTEWIVYHTNGLYQRSGVLIDTNPHFKIFSHAVGLLGLTRTVTLRFSSLPSLLTLHCTLVRHQLQYASVAWNCIISSDVYVDFKRWNCLSACSTSAPTDILNRRSVSVNMIGCYMIFLLHNSDTV